MNIRTRLLLAWLIVLVAVKAHCQLPDAPTPKRTDWHVISDPAPRHVNFFTFQPARTNRQTLTSPWFIVPHLAAFGTAIWNVRRMPAGNRQYGDALGPLVAIAGIDYVMDRWVWRPFSVGAASAAAILRARGAVTRSYE